MLEDGCVDVFGCHIDKSAHGMRCRDEDDVTAASFCLLHRQVTKEHENVEGWLIRSRYAHSRRMSLHGYSEVKVVYKDDTC